MMSLNKLHKKFLNILSSFLNSTKKFYHLRILKRKYYRFGKCLQCGACCKNIYIRHKNSVIQTEEEFEKIKQKDNYSFYQHITIIGKDDFGLVFECDKFDKEKRICKDHKNRPPICKNYPSEEIFSFGACLEENCGYSFKPIENFNEVFKKISKNTPKLFNKLN